MQINKLFEGNFSKRQFLRLKIGLFAKRNKMNIVKVTLVMLPFLFLQSCLSEKLPEPMESEFCETIDATYVATVKDIIDKNCAYSGCHISGFPSGDFSTYAGLESRINNGRINARVLDLRDMPPSNAPAATELTQEELDIFMCWVSAGYPEQ